MMACLRVVARPTNATLDVRLSALRSSRRKKWTKNAPPPRWVSGVYMMSGTNTLPTASFGASIAGSATLGATGAVSLGAVGFWVGGATWRAEGVGSSGRVGCSTAPAVRARDNTQQANAALGSGRGKRIRHRVRQDMRGAARERKSQARI